MAADSDTADKVDKGDVTPADTGAADGDNGGKESFVKTHKGLVIGGSIGLLVLLYLYLKNRSSSSSSSSSPATQYVPAAGGGGGSGTSAYLSQLMQAIQQNGAGVAQTNTLLEQYISGQSAASNPGSGTNSGNPNSTPGYGVKTINGQQYVLLGENGVGTFTGYNVGHNAPVYYLPPGGQLETGQHISTPGTQVFTPAFWAPYVSQNVVQQPD